MATQGMAEAERDADLRRPANTKEQREMHSIRWVISLLPLLTLPFQSALAAKDSSATACDQYAGPERRTIFHVNPAAMIVCAEALQRNPDTARFKYQYARGQHKQAMKREEQAATNLKNRQDYLNMAYKHYAAALKWYRIAAEQGDPRAQNGLGELYVQGLGTPGQQVLVPDPTEAARWFHRAADQNDSQAKTNIGLLHLHGHGVDKNPETAVDWFHKAEEQGNADAMFHLGQAYLEGVGVKPDTGKAVEWFRKAAKADHPSAGTTLGILYETGRGVPQDYREAIDWYTKPAFRWNDPVASNNMAVLFLKGVDERGRGRGEAMDLLTKSAAAGYQPATENLKRLQGPSLSPQMLIGAAIFAAVIAAGVNGDHGASADTGEDYNNRQMREAAERQWKCNMYGGGNPFKPPDCY